MRKGFTLAELLIALAILGVIAVFSIPKILQAQQYSRYNAAAHEVMASVDAAYQNFQVDNISVPSATKFDDLTPYLNFVSVLTSGQMDDHVGVNNTYICGQSGVLCLKLHNGGILFSNNASFGGVSSTNALLIYFDPDGTYGTSGVADGSSKSVAFFLYYNGAITSRANEYPGTCSSNSCPHTFYPNADPSWFSWN